MSSNSQRSKRKRLDLDLDLDRVALKTATTQRQFDEIVRFIEALERGSGNEYATESSKPFRLRRYWAEIIRCIDPTSRGFDLRVRGTYSAVYIHLTARYSYALQLIQILNAPDLIKKSLLPEHRGCGHVRWRAARRHQDR